MSAARLVAVLAALVALPASAVADVLDLESGFPLEIEDAYPIGYLGREAQLHLRYERTHDGEDGVHFLPRLEVGFPRNGQLSVAQRLATGGIEPDGVGPTVVELLYNLNQESLAFPALSVVAVADLPSGDDAHGVDAGGKLLLTKTLPGTWRLHRLHANVLYQANDDVRSGERGTRYKAVLGYSTVVTNELVLLGDVFREESFMEDEEHNVAEMGLRWAITPRAVVSAGIGFGFGDESPDVRTVLGIQHEF
jgi:hypothetical protein